MQVSHYIIDMRLYPLRSLQLYLFVILFYPTLWGYLGMSGITLGQLFYTISVLSIGFIILLFNKKKITFPIVYTDLFLLLTVTYAITLTFNALIPNGNISWADFTDLSRPIIYFSSLLMGYNIANQTINLKHLFKYIVYIILCCSLFDAIKFLPSGSEIMKLYTHLHPESFNYMRISGTFAYCYNYAYVLILGLLISLFCKNKIPTIIFLVLIILSGSRSAYCATIVALLLYSIIDKNYTTIPFNILIVVVIIYVLILFDKSFLDDIFSNIEKMWNALSGVGEDGSLNTRESQLHRAISSFYKNPLLGCGPLKSSEGPIEIQLGYYISSWGAIGTGVFLLIMGLFIRTAWITIKEGGTIGIFSKANLVWIICSFIIGLSTPITDQIRVSQLFFLIQGVQYRIYLQHKAVQNHPIYIY